MTFLEIDIGALVYFSLIVILSVILISIPSAIGYIFYMWLKRKNKTLGIFGLLLLFGIIIYTLISSYFAFYPRDKFFKREFSINTGIDFPTNAKILSKYAPYPNFQGGYNSTAIIKMDSNEFQEIRKTILRSNRFEHYNSIESHEIFYELSDSTELPILNALYKSQFDYENESFSIYFSSDFERIGFRYNRR
jgi:hypothetical protein